MNDKITLKGLWKFTIRDKKTGKIKRVQTYENIIPTVGRTMIANNLANVSPTNNMLVNYFAVGTGTTAPANGDTALETEVYRNEIASRTNGNNVAYFTGFIAAAEDDGTYREAGLFCDASATPDSGVLLSHVAINVTKSDTETLTVDITITIS